MQSPVAHLGAAERVAGAAGILPWAPGAPARDSGKEVGSYGCKVSVILNTSLNSDLSSFFRVWVTYFAESIFSSFLAGPVLKVS